MTHKKESLIVTRENPVLRKKAKSVPITDIKSKRIKDIIKKMQEAMHAEDDGVAIAAPQVGESLRIFVVNGEVLNMMKKSSEPQEDKKAEKVKDLVFINPEIIKLSRKKKDMEEGCLSVRWLYGKIKRSEQATITAYNEQGDKGTYGAGGLMAQIFQHEIDHLNGILFIDNAKDVVDLPPTPKQNV